jgi:hypothetical protein
MAFQLSPGINVSEVDLSTVVPSVATSTGAFAGTFSWGPVNQVITVSDEIRLADQFGKPNDTNYEYWFSAANFLAYSNSLRVVRAANTSTKNATANGAPSVLIQNEDDYYENYSSGANTYGEFAAKYAGDLGNSISVELVDSNTYTTWTYATQFTEAPATSDTVSGQGGANDEVHIVVLDAGGKWTGVANTVLERFAFASKSRDAKNSDGTSNYYKDVLNSRSNYVWWMSHPDAGTNWGGVASTNNYAIVKLGAATSPYYQKEFYGNYTSTNVLGAGYNNVAAGFVGLLRGTTANLMSSFEVLTPFLAKPTGVNYNTTQYGSGGEMAWGSGFLNDNSSYTDITFTLNAGTVTGGTIYVYGYGAS